jgi:DNA-binding Lrp family transcriptional regulator
MTVGADWVANDRPAAETAAAPVLSALDRALVNRLQKGLPLEATPYDAVGAELGMSGMDVCVRVGQLLESGLLTRFGPMFQIERAGGRFTLAAIAVPPDRFEEVAAIVNGFPEVAHNYERTHRLNMWFVLATETPAQCADAIRRIEQATGLVVVDMPKEREFHVQLYLPA